jgi:formylmethanofuran dehydrogenase subunit E
MRQDVPDHPDIVAAMKTGYPRQHKEELYLECDCCGETLYEDEVYEDEQYEHLCERCLHKLHRTWRTVDW